MWSRDDLKLIERFVTDTPLPRIAKVKQRFEGHALSNLEEELNRELQKPGNVDRIQPGQQVAVAVGSRGVYGIDVITRVVVEAIRSIGAEPFLVPAMGSHGGATAQGQIQVLASLGVTEESVGAPIRSSMEVVELGRLKNGLPVYIDKIAYQSDAIVVINRIKPHTAFRGDYESGITKMITIGLGKQKGAEACHAYSFKYMAENIPAMAKVILEKAPIAFGVGTIENAYDRPAQVVVLPKEAILQEEPALLKKAKALMPRFLVQDFDVLVVSEIGKNISGDGMDPNITGRYPTPYASGGPVYSKLVVLGLTEETHGNANGIGMADITTQETLAGIDWSATYANAITSTVMDSIRLPMVLPNDRLALQAAVKTCNHLEGKTPRIALIRNTLEMTEFYVSEGLLPYYEQQPQAEIAGSLFEIPFDASDKLMLFN